MNENITENNTADQHDLEEFYQDEELNLSVDEPRKIIWQAKDFSLREFQSMKHDGDLVLQPDYQRKYVMDVKLASRLIESILIDVPIPVVYLAEEMDGTYSVIDGQQRLTSFISFIEGVLPDSQVFKLKSLNVLKELNNKAFVDLDKEAQTKIKTTTIHTILIKKESPEDIKFEIFERLNTGSIKLNEDELRNSVYRGNYIKLLAELENDSDFHSLVKNDRYKKRMIYRGMFLRFFAFSEKTYLNYSASMKQFLNKELRDNQKLSDVKYTEYKKRFKHCVELVKMTFGENAFRRFVIDGSKGVNGQWTKGINTALFDVQMCGFIHYTKHDIAPHTDRIREAMIELILNDKFFQSIAVRTNDKDQVQTRFKMWFQSLDDIIGKVEDSQRAFKYETKKLLFKQDSTCQICKQQILMLEDSEVDHKIPFSKGGKTVIENAQLAHRFCNRSKSDSVL
jgi:uncharacterized protein with PIN domain